MIKTPIHLEKLHRVAAISLDKNFPRERLYGRIEQVFSRAVNVHIASQQRLCTILAKSCDNGPNSCRLPLEAFETFFNLHESVQFYPEGFKVGLNKWIDFSTATFWNPRRVNLTPSLIRSISWQAISEKILRQIENSRSLFFYQGNHLFYGELAKSLQHFRQTFLDALKQNANPQKALLGLLGLGIGLTPSGDDWLVGFCAIYLLPGHPGEKNRSIFLSTLEQAKDKTTALSALTLAAALNQQYRESLFNLINAIIHHEPIALKNAIEAVKKIGSSSGADMLCGMADACALTAHFGDDYVR